jgi:hypothetical protein
MAKNPIGSLTTSFLFIIGVYFQLKVKLTFHLFILIFNRSVVIHVLWLILMIFDHQTVLFPQQLFFIKYLLSFTFLLVATIIVRVLLIIVLLIFIAAIDSILLISFQNFHKLLPILPIVKHAGQEKINYGWDKDYTVN